MLILYFSKLGCKAESLKFLVIGDMGGLPTFPYTTPVEIGTAKEMAKVAKQYSPEFIMELGDNFYYDGVKNIEDSRFKVINYNAFHAKLKCRCVSTIKVVRIDL